MIDWFNQRFENPGSIIDGSKTEKTGIPPDYKQADNRKMKRWYSILSNVQSLFHLAIGD